MKIIKVNIDENGCATAAEQIPENAVMSVMTATEVTVYEEGDELPTYHQATTQ
jgi:hypothetical protein